MKPFQRCLMAVVLIASTAAAARAQSGLNQPDPAGWVPADALLYVGVTDLEALLTSFQKTAFYRVFEDPASKAPLGQTFLVSKFIEESKSRLAKILQSEPERLRNPLGGPLAIFLLPPTGSEKSPQAVLVASVRDRDLMKDYYGKILARLREQSDRHEMVTFGSDEIACFSRLPVASEGSDQSKGDEAEEEFKDEIAPGDLSEEGMARFVQMTLDKIFSPDALPEQIALCLSGERLVVAGTADLIRDVLRNQKHQRSLLHSEDYRTLMREFKPAGPVRFIVNLPGLLELAASESEEARNGFSVLGFQCLRSVVGHVDYGAEDYDGRFEALVQMSGERTGVPKILTMKNREVELDRSVPSETVLFASLNVSVLEVLDEIERMIRQTDPSAADEMRSSLQQVPVAPDGPLDLRKELFENLREPLTFAWAFLRPYGPDSPRMLLSIGHKNRPAMEQLLATLASSTGMLTQRELAGVQVFDAVAWITGISVAPTGDTVLLGNTPAVEARVHGSPTETLAEDAAFRRAARLVPREAWLMLYVDSYRLGEAALGLARHRDEIERMSFTNPAAMMSVPMLDSLVGVELTEEKVEAARKLLKYQAPSLVTVTTTSAGIRLTSIQLKPEAP